MSEQRAVLRQRVIRKPNRISRQCQVDAIWLPGEPGFRLSAWGARDVGLVIVLSAQELRRLVASAEEALAEIEEGKPE